MTKSTARKKTSSTGQTEPAELSLRVRLFIGFANLGLFLPIAVVFYEHHAKWLPIRLVIALWPASVVLLPDPTGISAIFLNGISIALNALAYGLVGMGIGGLIELARARE